MKIVVIDNYDSFTYNLVHYLEALEANVTVLRNDEFDMEELAKFDKILLSPGPGIPEDAGLLKEVIRHYGASKNILGVCLGLQAIGEVYGGKLINLEKVFHGRATTATQTVSDEKLFASIPRHFQVGRYHSWVVDPVSLPEMLEITSVDENGQIMSLRHRIFNVKGLQFHPESVLTPQGKKILENWLAP